MDVRPPLRWHHATTHLDRFAIVTWAVEPERLARHLPPGFEVDDRDGIGYLSVVPFLDRRFRFQAAPWPTLSCGQVNVRTYVRLADGRTGVWFFGTSLDSRWVTVPRVLWRMPWHRERVSVSEDWLVTVAGDFGGLRVALEPTEVPLGQAPWLIDPELGWYGRLGRSGGVGRYSVWHEPLGLRAAAVASSRVDLLHRLDLAPADAPPAWAGVLDTTTFDVHTPPVRER